MGPCPRSLTQVQVCPESVIPPPLPCMSERGCLNSVEVCLKPAHLILGLISTLSCLYVLLDANASQGPNLSLRHSVSQSLSDKDGHHVHLYVLFLCLYLCSYTFTPPTLHQLLHSQSLQHTHLLLLFLSVSFLSYPSQESRT